jgi:hypothetical protein
MYLLPVAWQVVLSKLWLVDSATSIEMVEVMRSRFTKEHPNVEMDRCCFHCTCFTVFFTLFVTVFFSL